MVRKIFTVDAWVVDANGAWHQYTGTPKTFDSKNYADDIEKTLNRAKGEFYDISGAMCKVDNRKLQTVVLMAEDGFMPIDPFTMGTLTEPDPEPEPEPEPSAE